ncbi:hypothetical protein LY76DRAFT_675340 [Colletotrichum caudatum]|nr:hypothetical protein LY76DRAFT_675340 [Colletotrichum caudatum]
MATVKNTPEIFNMDTDYTMPPSEAVNEAWSSLISKRGGFLTDHAISPGESCFAVFHHIHCLNVLRLAFYELHPDTKNSTSHHTEHGSQAIMCRPGLTADPFNLIVGGVTGFGAENPCINWRDMMDWMVVNE